MSNRLSVERLEVLEQKYGVEINTTAYLEYNEFEEQDEIKVIGEIMSGNLNTDLDVVTSVYNPQGEIIGTASSYIDSDTFEGIEPFSEIISIPKGEQVGKVRIYPKQC
ncbi:hypothetical protein [Paenibacillus gorillae]|uniref:hypothetical protein n=1 Tax=Paenibacillus gorillae TaxID=1243662 RepID=UPI0004B49D6B|nr:hypothetical protein [Paenibacillus gorillae]